MNSFLYSGFFLVGLWSFLSQGFPMQQHRPLSSSFSLLEPQDLSEQLSHPISSFISPSPMYEPMHWTGKDLNSAAIQFDDQNELNGLNDDYVQAGFFTHPSLLQPPNSHPSQNSPSLIHSSELTPISEPISSGTGLEGLEFFAPHEAQTISSLTPLQAPLQENYSIDDLVMSGGISSPSGNTSPTPRKRHRDLNQKDEPLIRSRHVSQLPAYTPVDQVPVGVTRLNTQSRFALRAENDASSLSSHPTTHSMLGDTNDYVLEQHPLLSPNPRSVAQTSNPGFKDVHASESFPSANQAVVPHPREQGSYSKPWDLGKTLGQLMSESRASGVSSYPNIPQSTPEQYRFSEIVSERYQQNAGRSIISTEIRDRHTSGTILSGSNIPEGPWSMNLGPMVHPSPYVIIESPCLNSAQAASCKMPTQLMISQEYQLDAARQVVTSSQPHAVGGPSFRAKLNSVAAAAVDSTDSGEPSSSENTPSSRRTREKKMSLASKLGNAELDDMLSQVKLQPTHFLIYMILRNDCVFDNALLGKMADVMDLPENVIKKKWQSLRSVSHGICLRNSRSKIGMCYYVNTALSVPPWSQDDVQKLEQYVITHKCHFVPTGVDAFVRDHMGSSFYSSCAVFRRLIDVRNELCVLGEEGQWALKPPSWSDPSPS